MSGGTPPSGPAAEIFEHADKRTYPRDSPTGSERITDALGTQDAEQDPGDVGDGDSEQAS
jgi:hypothetical protein